MSELVLGEYPAIEALAFAVLEMIRHVERAEKIPLEPPREEPRNILLRDSTKRTYQLAECGNGNIKCQD